MRQDADFDLKILCEHERFVIVEKPSGLLSHNLDIGPREQSVISLMRKRFGGSFYLCHRLDRGTSGTLLLAKDTESAAQLNRGFQLQSINKEYLAIVRGIVPRALEINRPLKIKRFSAPGSEKESQTFVEPLRSFVLSGSDKLLRKYSLVKVIPKTGRTHQIRRHLRGESFPIIGDRIYGKTEHNRYFEIEFNCRRLLLHCQGLDFEFNGGTFRCVSSALSVCNEYEAVVGNLENIVGQFQKSELMLNGDCGNRSI